MSQNLRKCYRVLKHISTIKDEQMRDSMLKHYCSKSCYRRALHEVAINVTRKDLPLSPAQRNIVRKNRRYLTPILRKRAARKHYVQTGKALPFLVPLLASVIPSI